MREIKFRALLDRTKYASPYKQWFYSDKMGLDKFFALAAANRLTPQEYTGLKDKNGKEIYEGDWVETPAGIGDIVWDKCYYIRWNPNDMTTLHDCQQSHLEAIGNIHEDKELLK